MSLNEFVAAAVAEEHSAVAAGPGVLCDALSGLLSDFEIANTRSEALVLCERVVAALLAAGMLPDRGTAQCATAPAPLPSPAPAPPVPQLPQPAAIAIAGLEIRELRASDKREVCEVYARLFAQVLGSATNWCFGERTAPSYHRGRSP